MPKDNSNIVAKHDVFVKNRIVYQNLMSSVPKVVASLEKDGLPTDDTINNLIIQKRGYSNEYILALLNSKLCTFYLKYRLLNCAILTVHLDKPYVGKIPVKDINQEHNTFITEKINSINDSNIQSIDAELNEYICRIYGLSDEEIDFVTNLIVH